MYTKISPLIFISFILLTIYGCQTKPLVYSLTTDKSELNFSSNEASESITISSTESWEVEEGDDSWLQVYPKSGKGGKNKINIDCKENSSSEARFSSLIIKSGDVTIEIEVTQKPRQIFTIATRLFEVFEFGDEIDISYYSNLTLTSVITGGKEWLTISTTKGVTETKFTIVVSPLNQDLERIGTINFNNEEGKSIDSLKIVQTTKKYSNRVILEKIYYSTDGNNWVNKNNWLSDKPLNEWYGVQMFGSDITGIYLQNNNLTGTIPKEIAKLDKIEEIYLWGNHLGGEIPSSIGALKSLRKLYLSNNIFSGQFPDSIFSLPNLTEVSVSNNFDLTFNIESAVEKLSSIELLALDNTFVNSPIPASIGNRKTLRFLSASGCRLSGDIPASIFSLVNLEYLSLNNNSLTGVFSRSIGELKNLTVLNLAGNNLTGRIPVELYSLKKLSALVLHQNQLTGSVPYAVTKLPNWGSFDPQTNITSQKNGVNLSIGGYVLGDILFDPSGNECGVVYLLTNESGSPISNQSGASLHGYGIKSSVNLTLWSRLYSDTPADDYNNGKENVESVLRYIQQNNLNQDDFPVFKWCVNQNSTEVLTWYIPSPSEALKISALSETINQSFKVIDNNLYIDNKIITSYDGNHSNSYTSVTITGSSVNSTEDKKSVCKAVLISRF